MMETAQPPSHAAWRTAWTFFVGVLLAYSILILAAKYPPPFVDFPDWVYQGFIFHGVLTAHPIAGYALKHYPVPNSTTTLGLGLLDTILPWQWSGKLWIVLYLALAAFSARTVIRALNLRQTRLVVALPAMLFLNLNFWYGHINFEIGLCLVLLLLAMLIRGAPKSLIATMLVLIFFTHMEACAAALLLLTIWSATTRSWSRLWAALPTIALTIWYATARFVGGNADARGLPAPDYHYGSPAFLLYKANTFFKIFGYVNARNAKGLSQSEQILGRHLFLLLIAASLITATLCLVQILRASTAPSADIPRKVITHFSLALLLISALLPQVWLGVADPGSRLILLAAAVGLLIIDWRGPAGLGIASLSALFCLTNLWQLAQIERNPRLPGHTADLPAALLLYGHVEPSSRLEYYDAIQRQQTTEPIFPTGLFSETAPRSTQVSPR